MFCANFVPPKMFLPGMFKKLSSGEQLKFHNSLECEINTELRADVRFWAAVQVGASQIPEVSL